MNQADIQNAQVILEQIFMEAIAHHQQHTTPVVADEIRELVETFIQHIEKNKSLTGALATSLVAKLAMPEQDIRYPRVDFVGGYSGRTLDTQAVTPFFKQHFPRYANKESAFLTLSTRESIEWTKEAGNTLKIRNKVLKTAFLNILDMVQKDGQLAHDFLGYLFARLLQRSQEENARYASLISAGQESPILHIPRVIEMMQRHFAMTQSSRLPVIAIYAIYETIMPRVKRYERMVLQPLNVHTASDKRGYGDIEIYDEGGHPFEIIEIKHQMPLTQDYVLDMIRKASDTRIQRYYLLTTYPDCFANPQEEITINHLVLGVKSKMGLEIIVNGILPTLKYYLRFVENYHHFIERYTANLILDAKQSTEITASHLDAWENILRNNASLPDSFP